MVSHYTGGNSPGAGILVIFRLSRRATPVLSTIWIKICGITRAEDAEAVANMGADALGVVLYGPSPRSIGVEQISAVLANARSSNTGSELTRVALFVDPQAELVAAVVATGLIDLLQFHGRESEQFCSQFGLPYMKAVRVRTPEQAQAEIDCHQAARMILLDRYQEDVPGGTGKTFDWNHAAKLVSANKQHIVLAGGLKPGNVEQALNVVAPFGVDVSSGVESSHGIKDLEKVKQFIEASRSVRS